MPNFARSGTVAKASRAIVSTHNLEATALRIARDSNRKQQGNEQQEMRVNEPVDPQIIQSMRDQGMEQGNFGPGEPIAPMHTPGTEPRQYQYMIGQNIVEQPRANEKVSFETMTSVLEMYDVAQMAIEVRLDELRNLDWDIVPYDENDTTKYESEIKQVRDFFEKPDGHMLFDEFQNIIAYDWLAYDALAIYPHLSKGGKLGALEPVDGRTITPLVDYYGRTPEAPAPAYMQWMYGMPWTWLSRDQLLYKPFNTSASSPYGRSPVEWMLTTINTDVRYQLYFLQYFTEGSIPDTWVNAPEGVTDPKQIKAIQDMYDATMVGNQAFKHRVKFLPPGSKPVQAKEIKFDINFPQFMLRKTCAAFKVTPAELGFTEMVNKSSGETQENVQFRRSIRPSAMFFSRIYTGIIHRYFGLKNLQFKYLNIDEQEDMLLMAQRDQIYIQAGVVSPDEVRVQRLGLDVDQNNPVPRVFISSRTILPVPAALKQAELANKQMEAQIEQEHAKTQTINGETQPPQETTQETQQESSPNDENYNAIDQTIEEEHQAEQTQKAMMDFFVKPPVENGQKM